MNTHPHHTHTHPDNKQRPTTPIQKYINTFVILQVGKLQQRYGGMRHVRHGQADSGRTGGIRTGRRHGLLGEQLRGRASQAVRVQKVSGPHTEDRRFRVPGRRFPGRLSGAVSQLAVQMSLVRLRRHRRARVPAQPSLQGHVGGYPGDDQRKYIIIDRI